MTPPISLRARGFTLIELVAVLVITGILGSVAASRFTGGANFDSSVYVDQLQSMVRHAQKLAIAQQRQVHVQVNGAFAALCYDAACTTASTNHVRAPSGQSGGAICGADASWFCLGVPRGVTVASNAFSFDAAGRPSFGASLSIAIGGPDGVARAVVIENETGYVH